jgi:hypothetical protein
MRILAPFGLTLALLALSAAPAAAQLDSGAAPDFETEWLQHTQKKSSDALADLRGRVVLVEFWRTW